MIASDVYMFQLRRLVASYGDFPSIPDLEFDYFVECLLTCVLCKQVPGPYRWALPDRLPTCLTPSTSQNKAFRYAAVPQC